MNIRTCKSGWTQLERHSGIDYDRARAVIQAIADSKSPDQSLDARMTLVNLDNGVFKPD